MKLRNKKTGGIVIKHIAITVDNEYQKTYSSLAELNEDWEDYEEPKRHYFISEFGKVYCIENIRFDRERLGWLKEFGNYFETKEEAEKAVEKLKAWKRLKDKGFRFEGLQKELKDTKFDIAPATIKFNKGGDFKWFLENKGDLFLLFGGEE